MENTITISYEAVFWFAVGVLIFISWLTGFLMGGAFGQKMEQEKAAEAGAGWWECSATGEPRFVYRRTR